MTGVLVCCVTAFRVYFARHLRHDRNDQGILGRRFKERSSRKGVLGRKSTKQSDGCFLSALAVLVRVFTTRS